MIQFAPYRYDPESRILYRDDEEILLPPRVLAVLESLLNRPGKVVPKEDLLASAWDGAYVGEDSLTQAISQLRQALDDDTQHPTYIQTIPRRGYRFVAEVERPLDEGSAAESDAPEQTAPELPTPTRSPLQSFLEPAKLLGISTILAVGVVVGLLLGRQGLEDPAEVPSGAGFRFVDELPEGQRLV